ncbi:MAG: hypothetical protein HY329_28345 [Chloroflexi bacterium]|nr:hypothetical protein [Chloroflexota bacterium]
MGRGTRLPVAPIRVAQGLTSRQIADRLVITEGTARIHVERILHKLGLRSRAQVAAWAAERGILAHFTLSARRSLSHIECSRSAGD